MVIKGLDLTEIGIWFEHGPEIGMSLWIKEGSVLLKVIKVSLFVCFVFNEEESSCLPFKFRDQKQLLQY